MNYITIRKMIKVTIHNINCVSNYFKNVINMIHTFTACLSNKKENKYVFEFT